MSYAEKYTVALVTAADGSVTAYTPVVTGRIVAVIYTKTDFADGVDFAITGEDSGQNIWTEANVNAAKTICPSQPLYSQAGVAMLYAAGGSAVGAPIHVAKERVKIAITNGGNVKTGAITVVLA